MKFDHIGIVVSDLKQETETFNRINGPMTWTSIIEEPVQKVFIRFGRAPEGHVYELLQPMDETSPVYNSLKTGKNIIHHMCYRTDDISVSGEELRQQGAIPTTAPVAGVAFGGALIQFFFQSNGWLIELVEGSNSPFDLFPYAM